MKFYYGVIYLKNGDSCVSRACKTEQEVIEALKKAVAREADKIKATSYMIRDSEEPIEFMFGHYRSRDLMQDKKFLKEITA